LDIDHARELSRTRYFWWTNYLTDYSGHDFLWEPVPWEAYQCHAWPSQHQANGGTMLVPKHASTEVNYLHATLPRAKSVPVIGVDHGNGLDMHCDSTTRYISDYLGTMRRALSKVDSEYVWVVSSICDYSNFDFTWHPSEWQAYMLHVFASNDQKFGDTFYVHVPSFLAKTQNLKILEWFETLHFVEDVMVPRLPIPAVQYTEDTVIDAIWNYEFRDPVVQFYRYAPCAVTPTVNLWQSVTKTVVPVIKDNSTVIVPRETKNLIQDQVYDYPYIDKTCRNWIEPKLQDIVFISYDEPDADANWAVLHERFPRALRVHGIAGMERALEVAADVATTPWYYAVFAKTRLYEEFDFSFVPDYMQQPKHYIFNSRNTVNGLEYGHMGIIMYNSAGIRKINRAGEFGLDYTMSFPHESIPLLSCYGSFDQTPYHTWRTAFREAGKLAYFETVKPTIDGVYRLDVWCTQATGPYADWSLTGARDGVEFVNASNHELATIKRAFRWEWLRRYFVKKYGNIE
jgi:hypothetical protein